MNVLSVVRKSVTLAIGYVILDLSQIVPKEYSSYLMNRAPGDL